MHARCVRSKQKRRFLRRWGFSFAVAGSLCLGYVMFRNDPSGAWQAFFPKCMFFWATGLHCPGCGCQRAIHHLFNGRFLLALQHNAIVIIALPWLVWEAARASLMFLDLPMPRCMAVRWRLSGNQAMAIAIAVTAFWILRNVPYGSLKWLSPPAGSTDSTGERAPGEIPVFGSSPDMHVHPTPAAATKSRG